MSAGDRVAEVVTRNALATAARLGLIQADSIARYVVADLDAAGLLAPPPPRTFGAGDPEPDDVRCVVDVDGDVLVRQPMPGNRGMHWCLGTMQAYWHGLLFPVVEVHLPGAPS